MRSILLALSLLFIWPPATALCQTKHYQAGIARLKVLSDIPFEALIWYPTDAEEAWWEIGPFQIPASHNATVATGVFPLVLLSHGGGVSGGSPLLLGELSAELARKGFVVVAPFHGKSGLSLRPLQIKSALDTVLADPRFKQHADATRLAMLGFSLGGAVTLELAGGVANMALFDAYCLAHADDVMSCNNAPGGGRADSVSKRALSREKPPQPLPLKAIVLLDPLAVPFQKKELRAVTMPVLVFRPDQSELPGEGNAVGLISTLPHPPEYETVPGSHFIFADVCLPSLQSVAPVVCRDPPDVDRAMVHAGIESRIARFFGENL